MALVETSTQIRTIRGRCGGNYFKHGTDGQHIQAMPRHVKFAHSPARSPGIGGFSSLAVLWLLALLAIYALAWAGFAAYNLFTTKSGERKRISGYNWYIHYGLTFPETERLPFWKPPTGPYQLPHFIAMGYRDNLFFRLTPEEWPDWWPYDYFTDRYEMYMGDHVYQTDDSKWFLWWNGERWVISPATGMIDPTRTWYGTTHEINVKYYCPHRDHYISVFPANRQWYRDHI